MKISACILTKNNEITLRKAILSVLPHVNEVIVLDTGSHDSTVRIAEELGAQVHFFLWNEDFSMARNASLEIARDSDWVLVIDSDEEFIWKGPARLREWLKEQQREQSVFLFECNHYELENSQLLSVTHVERLFSPVFFSYEGSIHEKLVSYSQDKIVKACLMGSFRHYGYSKAFHEMKSSRNTKLLLKAAQLAPHDGIHYRYLAGESYNVGKYTECIEYANIALRMLSEKERYSRCQAHYYMIMAQLQLNNISEAEQATRDCLQDTPAYADPYAIAAEIFYSTGRWEQAYDWYLEWERKFETKSETLPNHCASLVKTLMQHKAIAAIKTNRMRSLNRKEAHVMKVALLIVHPQLEVDFKELIEHIHTKLKGLSFQIGAWTFPNCNSSVNGLNSILKRSDIMMLQGSSVLEAAAEFAAQSGSGVIWIWKANERIVSDLNENGLIEAISRNGHVSVRTYSERLGIRYAEKRIWLENLFSMDNNISGLEAAATSCDTEANYEGSGSDSIIMERPFIVPPDKQEAYLDLSKREEPLQRMLAAFACQKYEKVLEMDVPFGSKEWTSFMFYRILSSINLGLIEEASELIYNALEAEINEKEQLEFIYLYGKLSQNTKIQEMKLEAIELIRSILDSNPMIDTVHVLTTESDWVALIAELQWQLGQRKQAILSWKHSLECSAYSNESCAYRLAEAVYEEYKNDGFEKVARTLLEIFNINSSKAQSLLYPLFSYLNMPEWAYLFQRLSEQSSGVKDQDVLVSIVLPVYNDTEYLFESIHSILSQTYLNLELIVVDDGSDNQVRVIVDRFNYDNRLKYYRIETNSGLPHALNYGVSKAKGSVLGWTSADNYAHPQWLERMIQTLSIHPNASGIYSDYYHIDENGLVIETKRLPVYKLNGLQNGGPSFLWKASSLRKAGGFDESLFGIEDRDFTIRLALSGSIASLPEPLYYYRIHNSSLSSRIDSGLLGGWAELHQKLKSKWLCLSFV